MDKYDITIKDIDFWVNGAFRGLYISWDSNQGFGEFDLSVNKETNKLFMDDEHMSKEFVMALFERLYEKVKSNG